MQAARRHRRHRHQAWGHPHTWGHRGHPSPPTATHPGHAGLGNGIASNVERGPQGFTSFPLAWRGLVSPRRGDSTRRSPPKHPPPRRGCGRVRGAANTPRRCIIYKVEEQRARRQLQSPPEPPCPAVTQPPNPLARWHCSPGGHGGQQGQGCPWGWQSHGAPRCHPGVPCPFGSGMRLVQHAGTSSAPSCPHCSGATPQATACGPVAGGFGDGSKGVPTQGAASPPAAAQGRAPPAPQHPSPRAGCGPGISSHHPAPLAPANRFSSSLAESSRLLPPTTSPTSRTQERWRWGGRLSWGF